MRQDMKDDASKQTALFFGFLAAAMTAASAQGAPAAERAHLRSAVHQTATQPQAAARPAPADRQRARPAPAAAAKRAS
jgi:hypothetical protein